MAGVLAVTAASEAAAGDDSGTAIDRIEMHMELILKKFTALDRIEVMLQKISTSIPLPPSFSAPPPSSQPPPVAATTLPFPPPSQNLNPSSSLQFSDPPPSSSISLAGIHKEEERKIKEKENNGEDEPEMEIAPLPSQTAITGIRAKVMKPVQPRGSTQRFTFLADPSQSKLPNPIRVMDRLSSTRAGPDPFINPSTRVAVPTQIQFSPPTLVANPYLNANSGSALNRLDPTRQIMFPDPVTVGLPSSPFLHQFGSVFKLPLGIQLLLGLCDYKVDKCYTKGDDNLEILEPISFFFLIFDVH